MQLFKDLQNETDLFHTSNRIVTFCVLNESEITPTFFIVISYQWTLYLTNIICCTLAMLCLIHKSMTNNEP